MTLTDWLGSIGVALLLVAFLLNLAGWLAISSAGYKVLNAVGAGLACAAAVLIPFYPFVLLEGVWCLVALAALVWPSGSSRTSQPETRS